MTFVQPSVLVHCENTIFGSNVYDRSQ
jgi:hypothetical protein